MVTVRLPKVKGERKLLFISKITPGLTAIIPLIENSLGFNHLEDIMNLLSLCEAVKMPTLISCPIQYGYAVAH